MPAVLVGAEGGVVWLCVEKFSRYLKPPRKRLGWLRLDRVPGEWGIQWENATGRREFGDLMEVAGQGEKLERENNM